MRARSRAPTATSRRRRTSTTSRPTSVWARITSRTTTRPASCSICRSAPGGATRATRRRSSTRSSAAGRSPASTPSTPVSPSPSPTRRRAAFQVSGIQQDFRGANNYRPNVIGEVMVPEDQRTVQNWFSRAGVVVPTDPSQPFGNAAAQRVSRADGVAGGLRRVEAIPDAVAQRQPGVPRRVLQSVQSHELPRAERQHQPAAAFGTITATYDPRIIQFGSEGEFLAERDGGAEAPPLLLDPDGREDSVVAGLQAPPSSQGRGTLALAIR